jgi:hypothetical protein
VYASLRWVLQVQSVELLVLIFMLDTTFVVTYLVAGGSSIVQRQQSHSRDGDAISSDGVLGSHELQHMASIFRSVGVGDPVTNFSLSSCGNVSVDLNRYLVERTR